VLAPSYGDTKEPLKNAMVPKESLRQYGRENFQNSVSAEDHLLVLTDKLLLDEALKRGVTAGRSFRLPQKYLATTSKKIRERGKKSF